jgi:predicted nucleotidyltransferase
MEAVNDETGLLERVKAAVHALAPGAEIILFGSRARDTAGDHSDWDFLILLASARDRSLESQIKDRLYDIELDTGTVLSSVIRTKQEWQSSRYAVLPLRQQIERDGIRL